MTHTVLRGKNKEMNTDALETQLMTLPPDRRALLAERLLASLEGVETSPEIEQAWREESLLRYRRVVSGESSCREADEVMGEARRSLQ